MLKEIYLPHKGINVKLGRTQPAPGEPKLKLAKYLAKPLPEPPSMVDHSPDAMTSLSDVYLNDRYGDCVIAGGYHMLGVATGNSGKTFVATPQQIIADYSAIGGFDPRRPSMTDRGCNEQEALNYWTRHGFANGTKLLGWVAIDATNPKLVRQAVWLFQGVMFGVCMPDAWLGPQMPRGNAFTWDVAGGANPNNGHCFVGVGYNPVGVKIDTWGLIGTLTYAAISRYAVQQRGGELYVALTDASIVAANKKTAGGIDLATLVEDLNTIGGNVTVDVPATKPPPDPIS